MTGNDLVLWFHFDETDWTQYAPQAAQMAVLFNLMIKSNDPSLFIASGNNTQVRNFITGINALVQPYLMIKYSPLFSSLWYQFLLVAASASVLGKFPPLQ